MCFEYLWHKIEFYLIFSIHSIRKAFGIWNSEIKVVVVFQLPSCVWLCDPMDCSTPGFPVLNYLQEFAQTHLHWVSDAIQTSHPVTSFCPQCFPESGPFSMSWLFTSASQSFGSFSFSISPSNEYSGFISFRIDWFDLPVVQGTLSSLLQHHNSKASVLQHSAFFMIQISHLYMTTGKTIALIIWTFLGKVMCLLFNMLSRFVLAFLSGSQHLNCMAAVTICIDFGAQEKRLRWCH